MSKDLIVINGKTYPLWQQFVDNKAQYIGGTLRDYDYEDDVLTTEITDITLEPNGIDSACFSVNGKDFGCGFDVSIGGLSNSDRFGKNTIAFRGFHGHTWTITPPKNQ